jgi:hypothetical protein
VPPAVVDSALLTSYAWEARYPGLSEPATIEEYHEALRQAEIVFNWAKEKIGVKGKRRF